MIDATEGAPISSPAAINMEGITENTIELFTVPVPINMECITEHQSTGGNIQVRRQKKRQQVEETTWTQRKQMRLTNEGKNIWERKKKAMENGTIRFPKMQKCFSLTEEDIQSNFSELTRLEYKYIIL